MHELDAIETINFDQLATAMDRLLLYRGRLPQHRRRPEQISPDRTLIVRPRRRDFDAATIVVSSLVSGLLFAFVALAGLV
jgi:hypothetical protein